MKEPFLRVQNSLVELEKDFVELKERELKNREVNYRRTIF